MKKILVTGGTGTLGKEIVSKLLDNMQSVMILSTQKNPKVPKSVEVLEGDLTEKKSLPETLNEVEIVVHCASNPLNPTQVDVKGTNNLLSLLKTANLKHFIYISIVGVNKSNYLYYQAKYVTEKMIAASGIPFSVLRVTQFHDFVLHRLIIQADKIDNSTITIPANMRFQTIDIKEVANRIWELIGQNPKESVLSIGGPEILSLEEMTESYLHIIGIKKQIKLNPADESFTAFKSGINLYPNNKYGKVTWETYLRNRI